MNILFLCLIATLGVFTIQNAYAQLGIEELRLQGAEAGIIGARHLDKLNDIMQTCVDRLEHDDTTISLKPCVDFINAYNEAMGNLYSTHRDIVESIFTTRR